MWTVGMTLGGRYRLDALLGTDPVTGVWAATHVSTGRRVALRQLPAVSDIGAAESARIVNEMRVVSAFEHVHVAPTYEVVSGLAEGPLLASALLVGETLAELLAKTPMLSLQQTIAILLPVVSAVGAAHARGIVHGRLSPSSIFICQAGPSKVKVLDFGVAKWTAAQRPAPASVRGAPSAPRRSSDYAPPEEAVPGRTLDHRADIWAIGIIAYECLSGMRPADFIPPEQAFLEAAAALVPIERHVPGLPRPLTDAIADLVVADPEHRAQNLIELFSLLGPYAEEPSPSFGWPGSERRITGLTQGLPALVPVDPKATAAPVRAPVRLPSWRVLALAASAVAAAELVLLVALVSRLRTSEARWATLARAVSESSAGAVAGSNEPRSESMTLRAAPPAVVVDDFEGADDAPTLAALEPWQAFTLEPSERALPLLRGPGAGGEHGLEVRFLMDDAGASGRSAAGAASRVRGGVLDLSRYSALSFAHRLAPLRAPGLACKSPGAFVAFVTCRPGSDQALQRLELEVPISEAWSSASLKLGELRLPAGAAPNAGERFACLSAVDGIGFRVDETAPEASGCDGGTLGIDDITLR